MKKTMLWILALSSLALNTQVSANWTYITSASNGSNWYLNFDSLKNGNGFRKFTSLQQKPDGEISAQSGWVDCLYPAGHRKFQFDEFASYIDGQPHQVIKTNDSQFKPIPPGSILESLTDRVCHISEIVDHQQQSAYAPFIVPPSNQFYFANVPANSYQSVQRVHGACAENGSCSGDISSYTGRPKTVYVNGYNRRDGTYVRGHYRSSPRR